MISDFIIYSALLMGGIYLICWLCSRRFRATIEQPKYRFMQKLHQHDRGRNASGSGEDQSHV